MSQPYDEADHRAMCHDKRCHATKRQAKNALRYWLQSGGGAAGVKYRVYRCDYCRSFHFGRKRVVNKGNAASQYDRPIRVDRPPPEQGV